MANGQARVSALLGGLCQVSFGPARVDSIFRLDGAIVLGGSYNPAYTLGYNLGYNQDRITFPLSYLS